MSDPTTSFGELPLATFVDRLASVEPVPGGGTASAVSAAHGAALLAMVAALSDRPRYAEHATLHARAGEVGRRLATRFLQLADADSAAYATLAAAMKLPKESDEERATRTTAMRAAARDASQVPLETVEACLELVSAVESMAGRSNANAASDLNVAALLAEAAARGAAENVLVNLPMLGDESAAGTLTVRVMRLIDDIEDLAAATHAIVRSGDRRGPVSA